jgi:hypothetical protein
MLSKDSQDKISSAYIAKKLMSINNAFNMNTTSTTILAIAIRKYYFGELKIEDFPFHLAKEIPIDLSKAKEITAMVLREIIQDDSQEKAAQAQLENLTLAEALKIYPEIGEQLVTSDRINVLNFPEPARPSVKNWIADYTSVLGYEDHSAIVRGNFIFHSPNTQKLNNVDRQKLAQLLKSFDEKTPLTINKNTKQIIFSGVNTAPAKQPSLAPRPVAPIPASRPVPNQIQPTKIPPANTQARPTNKISFSSPQKLSYEKLEPYRINPVSRRMQSDTDSKDADKKALGKNVVNLREV